MVPCLLPLGIFQETSDEWNPEIEILPYIGVAAILVILSSLRDQIILSSIINSYPRVEPDCIFMSKMLIRTELSYTWVWFPQMTMVYSVVTHEKSDVIVFQPYTTNMPFE